MFLCEWKLLFWAYASLSQGTHRVPGCSTRCTHRLQWGFLITVHKQCVMWTSVPTWMTNSKLINQTLKSSGEQHLWKRIPFLFWYLSSRLQHIILLRNISTCYDQMDFYECSQGAPSDIFPSDLESKMDWKSKRGRGIYSFVLQKNNRNCELKLVLYLPTAAVAAAVQLAGKSHQN